MLMKRKVFIFMVFSVLCAACNHAPPVGENELLDLLVATHEEDPIEDFTKIEEEKDNKNSMDSMNTAIFDLDLKTQLAFLKAYNYFENESFDIDQFSLSMADRLTAYLKEHELTNAQSDSIGFELCIDKVEFNAVKLYNFNYHSGGTRGLISHPIIQWISLDGELCSYNLSKNINCYFSEIYSLSSSDKTLYILLGQESGSGACVQNIVYCIEINNNRLIVTNPIFVNRPYINFCNISFEFKQSTEELIGFDEYDMSDDLKARVEEQGIYSESNSMNQVLVGLLDGLYSESETILLKFNGEKFEKQY